MDWHLLFNFAVILVLVIYGKKKVWDQSFKPMQGFTFICAALVFFLVHHLDNILKGLGFHEQRGDIVVGWKWLDDSLNLHKKYYTVKWNVLFSPLTFSCFTSSSSSSEMSTLLTRWWLLFSPLTWKYSPVFVSLKRYIELRTRSQPFIQSVGLALLVHERACSYA